MSAGGAEVPDTPITCLGDDAMDTSKTLAGGRDRAPVEGAMDSDIPTQSLSKEGRLGDLHRTFVTDKDGVTERAQGWRSDMQDKIGTRARVDPWASYVLDGGGPVLSA